MKIDEGISGAIFSQNRQYRYALWRVWDREKPALIFIGLNPSHADEVKDDATVSKLAWHTKMLKYGGLYKQALRDMAHWPKIAEAWHRAAIHYWERGTEGGKKFKSADEFWLFWLSRKKQGAAGACPMFS